MENIPQSKEDGTDQDLEIKKTLNNDVQISPNFSMEPVLVKNPLIDSISKRYKGILRTSSKKTISIPIQQKRYIIQKFYFYGI